MKRGIGIAAAVCCAVEGVSGQVTPIPQFTGDLSDHFDFAVPGSAVPSKELFGGAVIISEPPDGGGSVKVETWSSLGGNVLSPHTGPWMISVLFGDGDLRPATFTFNDDNVHRFGGFFGNNSPTDDAFIEFFGSGRESLGRFRLSIPSAGNVWTWHGFESTIPIKTVTLKGFSPPPFSGGFIWFDDLELGYTAPSTCQADGNGDGAVDVPDLLAVLNSWGPCPAPCPADGNGDGVVNVPDLLALLNSWGACP